MNQKNIVSLCAQAGAPFALIKKGFSRLSVEQKEWLKTVGIAALVFYFGFGLLRAFAVLGTNAHMPMCNMVYDWWWIKIAHLIHLA